MRKTDFECRDLKRCGLPVFSGFGPPRSNAANISARRDLPTSAVENTSRFRAPHSDGPIDDLYQPQAPHPQLRVRTVPASDHLDQTGAARFSEADEASKAKEDRSGGDKKDNGHAMPAKLWTFPTGSKYPGHTLARVARRAPKYFNHIHSKLCKEPQKISRFPGLAQALAAFQDEFRSEIKIINEHFNETQSTTATAYSDMAKHMHLLQRLIEQWTEDHKLEMDRSEEKYIQATRKNRDQIARLSEEQLEYAKWLRLDIRGVESKVLKGMQDITNTVSIATEEIQRVRATVLDQNQRIDSVVEGVGRVDATVREQGRKIDSVAGAISNMAKTLEDVKMASGGMEVIERRFDKIETLVQQSNVSNTGAGEETGSLRSPNSAPRIDEATFAPLLALPSDIKDASVAGLRDIQAFIKDSALQTDQASLNLLLALPTNVKDAISAELQDIEAVIKNSAPKIDQSTLNKLLTLPNDVHDASAAELRNINAILEDLLDRQKRLEIDVREKTTMHSELADLARDHYSLQARVNALDSPNQSRNDTVQQKEGTLPRHDDAKTVSERDSMIENRLNWKGEVEAASGREKETNDRYTVIAASQPTDPSKYENAQTFEAVFGGAALRDVEATSSPWKTSR